MLKKNLWIVALMAVLAMVFVGCDPDGGGSKVEDSRDWATEPLTITDADKIGALLVATHLFNEKTGDALQDADGKAVVSSNKNVATFNFPGTTDIDNLGFRIDLPQEAKDLRYRAVEITYKLTKVTTLTTGQFAKIGFKEKAYPESKVDMEPYADYELWFGTPAAGSVANGEGSEQTLRIPLYNPNKAPMGAVWFTHNQYEGKTGSYAGKFGSAGPINYELTITKIYLDASIVAKDLTKDNFTVGKTNQYLKDNKGTSTPITAVTVTVKDGIDIGTISIAYEGAGDTTYAKSATVPQIAGTFNILVSAPGSDTWKKATDLNVGTLTVGEQAPPEKFKLSTDAVFQAKQVGAKEDVLVDGLAAAGSVEFEVISVDGKKALQLTTSAGWQGLDLNNSYFEFAESDQVKVVAKVVTITPAETGSPEILLQGKPGAWGPIGANPGVTEGETVTLDRVLSATDVANIKGSSPAAIRIQLNNVASAVFEIHEIIITEGDPSVGTVSIAAEGDAALIEGVTLKATYTGDVTGFTYQWKKGGVDIDGATTNTLVTETSGTYTVVVSKVGFTSATSNALIVQPSSLDPEVILEDFADIKFTGWGDLGSVGGNVTFTFKRSQYGCNTTYVIPDEYLAYDFIEISYTVERLEDEAGVADMKLTIKDLVKDSWDPTDNQEYVDLNADGDYTFETELSWATSGSITFSHNDGGAVAADGNFKLTITKIRFYLDE